MDSVELESENEFEGFDISEDELDCLIVLGQEREQDILQNMYVSYVDSDDISSDESSLSIVNIPESDPEWMYDDVSK